MEEEDVERKTNEPIIKKAIRIDNDESSSAHSLSAIEEEQEGGSSISEHISISQADSLEVSGSNEYIQLGAKGKQLFNLTSPSSVSPVPSKFNIDLEQNLDIKFSKDDSMGGRSSKAENSNDITPHDSLNVASSKEVTTKESEKSLELPSSKSNHDDSKLVSATNNDQATSEMVVKGLVNQTVDNVITATIWKTPKPLEVKISSDSSEAIRKDSLPLLDRDSMSFTTNSTEYRTLDDDYNTKVFNFKQAIDERDAIIADLTSSLQDSIHSRDQLQAQGDKLTLEVMQLRKQLMDTLDTIRKDKCDEGSQRLSEVNIDLISEPEDDGAIEQNLDQLREMSTERTEEHIDEELNEDLKNFTKFLNPEEYRLFHMVQKKFNDFLFEQKLNDEKQNESDIKLIRDEFETFKIKKECELNKLRELLVNIKSGSNEVNELREELKAHYAKETEHLREYFEKKCTDLEKNYSEEIFSQQSRRHSNETNSSATDQEDDLSDGENLSAKYSSHSSPRHKSKNVIYSNTTHLKLTPTEIDEKTKSLNIHGPFGDAGNEQSNNINSEIRIFYENKLAENKRKYEEIIEKLSNKVKDIRFQNSDCEEYANKENERIDINCDEVAAIRVEYEERLKNQISCAKTDLTNELVQHIENYLSEPSTVQEKFWPKELILLKEKFTAESQLEVTQLQIKHNEEMDKMKTDYERQLRWKNKRNETFDSARNFTEVSVERDNLRELSGSFRFLLQGLVKYVSACEDEVNKSTVLNSDTIDDGDVLNVSNASQSKRLNISQNVTGILTVIEDPSLKAFIEQTKDVCGDFKLTECLNKLRTETSNLLALCNSLTDERLNDDKHSGDTYVSSEKEYSEEEDGLKSTKKYAKQSISLQDNCSTDKLPINETISQFISLPLANSNSNAEILININDLQDLLMKAKNDNSELFNELTNVRTSYEQLKDEYNSYKSKYGNSLSEDLSEGYGISQLQSPPREHIESLTVFGELHKRARDVLNNSIDEVGKDPILLINLIEEFCRESDKFVEERKQEKDDLQSQSIKLSSKSVHSECCDKIEAADKKLKSTTLFLEAQATEREQERDEFLKEIEKLKIMLKDKEKELVSKDNKVKELDRIEMEYKELVDKNTNLESIKIKFQNDLKETIKKTFELREIIADLENQIESKNVENQFLTMKAKELEQLFSVQGESSNFITDELDKLKKETIPNYLKRISDLEDQLKNSRPSDENEKLIEHITEQLTDIELTIEKKTKTLENLHASIGSLSCSTPSEDVSVKGERKQGTPRSPLSLPTDEIIRIFDKLAKHTRAEEATMKRINDLDMQISQINSAFLDIQTERDTLQEKLSEQMSVIESLQSRLDDHRNRSEELMKRNTSEMVLQIHELRSEINDLKETLSIRDKQIATLKQNIEQSRIMIERQEAELALRSESIQDKLQKTETDLKLKLEENNKLKEKMKSQMINKLALPDLVDTMLADKNEEIDCLRAQLQKLERSLEIYVELNLSQGEIDKLKNRKQHSDNENERSDRTLNLVLSISSDVNEPDQLRKDATEMFAFSLPTLRTTQENMVSLKSLPNDLKSIPSQFESKVIDFSSFNLVQKTPEKELLIKSALESPDLQTTGDKLLTTLKEIRNQLENYNKEMPSEVIAIIKDITNFIYNATGLDTIDAALIVRNNAVQDLKLKIHQLTEQETLNETLNKKVIDLTKIIESLNALILTKDELLLKHEKNILNYAKNETQYLAQIKQLESQLAKAKTQKLLNELNELRSKLADTRNELSDVLIKYRQEKLVGERLTKELEDLKGGLNTDDIIDITACVEKELNYSAELDSNIKRAIEGDADKDFNIGTSDKPIETAKSLQEKYELEKLNTERLQQKLDSIQSEDANIIEALRIRLENAIKNEMELQKLFEQERNKCAKLSADIFSFERQKSRENSLLTTKSLGERTAKEIDLQSDILRLQSEINMLTAQNNRERERFADMQTVLNREKNRFETELSDHIRHNERIKEDLSNVIRERDRLERELQEIEGKYAMAMCEVNELKSQVNLNNLSNHESVDKENFMAISSKLNLALEERDILRLQVETLRGDMERSAKREAKLMESLLSKSNEESYVPEKFLDKLKEMNGLMIENSQENSRMAASLHVLTTERRELQKKINEMEKSGHIQLDLEERMNHLFGKYLRVESFRKALVHQKRYLLIMLAQYQANEESALTLIGTNRKGRKRISFKSATLAIIAIARMKYIVHRWHTGKRVGAQAIISRPIFRRSITEVGYKPNQLHQAA